MPDKVDIQFEDQEVKAMLDRLLRKMKNPKPLMQEYGKYMQAETVKMFKGRRPDTSGVRGQKWPKLAPSTIAARKAAAKRGAGIIAGDRPLVRTGRMRDSLMKKNAIKLIRQGVEYGTDLTTRKGFSYPGFHQQGNSRVPARKWLFLTRQDLKQMVKMAVDYLKGRLRRQ